MTQYLEVPDEVMKSDEFRAKILADPCTHHWLGKAIMESNERDIVDMLNDAEVLVKYLHKRLVEETEKLYNMRGLS